MNKADKDVLKFWVIAISGMLALFFGITNISSLRNQHRESSVGCYTLAQQWQRDVDIGPVVANAFKDNYFSVAECTDLKDSIENIGQVRQDRWESAQKKIIASGIVKGE